MYQVTIKTITSFQDNKFTDLAELNLQIPELERGISSEEIQKRIGDKPFLLLLAYVEGEIAGYKLGYELDKCIFYSWVGGVAQDFRNMGIAEMLLESQESWSQKKHYQTLQVKTKNSFTAMLSMLIKHKYQIMNINNQHPQVSQYKMLLSKSLI